MAGALAALGGGSTGGSALKVTVTRNNLFGYRFADMGSVVTSQSTTAVISGGVPPYTGVWTLKSGDAAVGNTGTGPTTYFGAYSGTPASFSAVYRYVVTDAASTVVESDDVYVNLELYTNVS